MVDMVQRRYWTILPYEAVRSADDPEATLLSFLNSTYEAAASLGDWDRTQECSQGQKGRVLPIAG